jgi:hypothetical protein
MASFHPPASVCLKRGSAGDIRLETVGGETRIVRDLTTARRGCRWLARRLARREARALRRLAGTPGIPRLLGRETDRLERSFVAGAPMHEAKPRDLAWFRDAHSLLRRMHRAGVAHNDLAKEANWICRSDTTAGLVDFQLAICFAQRGHLFRWLAREDLRHLLKHKAHYRLDALTARERRLLARPSWPARGWRRLFKPVYHFVTRRLLGWPERDGAAERERPSANRRRPA